MPGTKGEATRERILGAAMELINRKSFHLTSINEILAAGDIKKGNLYFHFAGKEDLGLALVAKAKADYLAYLAASLKSCTPLGQLGYILMDVYKLHSHRRCMGGCIFGNIALEMSDDNPLFAAAIREIFDEWNGLLSRLLTQARADGELDPAVQPEATARHIVASLEGAIMMARLTKQENEILNCIQPLRNMPGIPSQARARAKTMERAL